MTAPLETLRAQLAESRSAFLAATEGVDSAAASWKENGSRWSVAEIAEHLVLVEGGVVAIFDRALKNSGETPRALSSYEPPPLLKGVDLVNDERKVDAPSFVVPTQNLSLESSIGALGLSRQRLLETLVLADGLPLETIVVAHPLLGTLNLYEWLVFLAQHELRHTKQIVRTRRAADGLSG